MPRFCARAVPCVAQVARAARRRERAAHALQSASLQSHSGRRAACLAVRRFCVNGGAPRRGVSIRARAQRVLVLAKECVH
eukprot:15449539-Alexandrium_andersonii.AAC.1